MHIIILLTAISNTIMISLTQFPNVPPVPYSYPMQFMGTPMGMPNYPAQFPHQRFPTVMLPMVPQPQPQPQQKEAGRYHSHRRHHHGPPSDSSSHEYNSGHSGHKKCGRKKRQVLTPMISYVTDNGRVVFSKKIRNENIDNFLEDYEISEESSEEMGREMKQRHKIETRQDR